MPIYACNIVFLHVTPKIQIVMQIIVQRSHNTLFEELKKSVLIDKDFLHFTLSIGV